MTEVEGLRTVQRGTKFSRTEGSARDDDTQFPDRKSVEKLCLIKIVAQTISIQILDVRDDFVTLSNFHSLLSC